ncbi:alpha/beta hydrolase [Dactylosporangium darangshiense]|uniref:Alpha/beta hydrolase n=1 Tax=Dactylosporangium darangshiense TaxID=579108 RepID=A0ABP8DUE5_9ACTN
MADVQSYPTVVLVHGAFADASGFAGVIRELEASGITTLAPANPLRGLSIDADYVKAYVAAIEGPVVLVGHSYGGAVVTQASADLDNVTGLVYLAAWGLDEGERFVDAVAPFPPSMLASTSQPTNYPAGGGTPEGPDLYIDRKLFRETFCADVPVDVADVMAATQRPIAAAALSEPCTAAGWKTRPSWFLVSANDNAISPEAETFMAKRMGATTEVIDGSHVAFIAKPVEVADFIKKALSATP